MDCNVVVVFALLMTWLSVELVDVPKFAEPLYTTRMLWVPMDRLEIVKDALPELFRVSVARVVVPSRNETVPVGVPCVEETVVLNVTGAP